MRVLIVGDTHERHAELAALLRELQTLYGIEAAIQVGDFGFTREAMGRLQEDGIRFPVPLYAIDGNHDDHPWLLQSGLVHAPGEWRKEHNLTYQPRASVARIGGATVGFLGGALHVDRPQNRHAAHRTANYILREERERAAALFNRERPDLLVTHTCPAGIGVGIAGQDALAQGIAEHIVGAGFDPGPADDCGEAELTALWRDLAYRPRAWVFGHFHRSHNAIVEGTRFVCAGDDLSVLRETITLWDADERALLSIRC